jgi:hypothetical protein
MDLQRKFAAVSTNNGISIGCLKENTPYDILYAERTVTRFGPTVILTILIDPPHLAKVFMPKRYGDLFTEDNIHDIQKGKINLQLIYLGTCPVSKSFMLSIEIAAGSSAGTSAL